MKIHLAHIDGAQGTKTLVKEGSGEPSLLVSYVYLDPFLRNQSNYKYRDWMLDSGAFSAFNSGMQIDLMEYTEKCRELLAGDKTLLEVVALDEISKSEGKLAHKIAARNSLKNTETMWKKGIKAIPTFHIGDPEEYLVHIAKEYPKIAIGGVARLKGRKKFEFLGACFRRVWPKKIHGFACCDSKLILSFPFHSVDATSWELGPCGFGNWKTFGKMSVRGSNQNLKAEIEYYLGLERRANNRWQKEMRLLEG